MAQSQSDPRTPGQHGFRSPACHVCVLFSLAFAARLYESLGRQPAFFAVRQSHLIDVAGLVLVLSVLWPAAILLWQWLLGLVSRRLQQASYAAILLLLLTAIGLPLLKQVPRLPSPAAVGLAVAVGRLATALYFRLRFSRSPLQLSRCL
jgi:hypothetical protein